MHDVALALDAVAAAPGSKTPPSVPYLAVVPDADDHGASGTTALGWTPTPDNPLRDLIGHLLATGAASVLERHASEGSRGGGLRVTSVDGREPLIVADDGLGLRPAEVRALLTASVSGVDALEALAKLSDPDRPAGVPDLATTLRACLLVGEDVEVRSRPAGHPEAATLRVTISADGRARVSLKGVTVQASGTEIRLLVDRHHREALGPELLPALVRELAAGVPVAVSIDGLPVNDVPVEEIALEEPTDDEARVEALLAAYDEDAEEDGGAEVVEDEAAVNDETEDVVEDEVVEVVEDEVVETEPEVDEAPEVEPEAVVEDEVEAEADVVEDAVAEPETEEVVAEETLLEEALELETPADEQVEAVEPEAAVVDEVVEQPVVEVESAAVVDEVVEQPVVEVESAAEVVEAEVQPAVLEPEVVAEVEPVAPAAEPVAPAAEPVAAAPEPVAPAPAPVAPPVVAAPMVDPFRQAADERAARVAALLGTQPLAVLPLEPTAGGLRATAAVLPAGVVAQHVVELNGQRIADVPAGLVPAWMTMCSLVVDLTSVGGAGDDVSVRAHFGRALYAALLGLSQEDPAAFAKVLVAHPSLLALAGHV